MDNGSQVMAMAGEINYLAETMEIRGGRNRQK